MTDSFEWLAGIIEGEGCIGLSCNNHTLADGSVTRYSYPNVQVGMTDLDIIERVHAAAGCGRVYGPYEHKGRHKPHWRWHVHGVAARDLIVRLRPLMGARRTARIDEVMAPYGT